MVRDSIINMRDDFGSVDLHDNIIYCDTFSTVYGYNLIEFRTNMQIS